MSGGAAGGGSARSGRGGRTKPGSRGPAPAATARKSSKARDRPRAAHLRPGHPAQRRAAAKAAGQSAGRGAGPSGGRGADRDSRAADRPGRPAERGGRAADRARGAGDAPEVVAGRNAVLESLRARVPATALYAGPRDGSDPRFNEVIRLAADVGIPVIEAGRPELDRLTGGAVHQSLALKVRPYDYAHPGRPAAAGPGPRRGTADRGPGRGHRPAQPRRGRPLGRGVRRRTACWSPRGVPPT